MTDPKTNELKTDRLLEVVETLLLLIARFCKMPPLLLGNGAGGLQSCSRPILDFTAAGLICESGSTNCGLDAKPWIESKRVGPNTGDSVTSTSDTTGVEAGVGGTFVETVIGVGVKGAGVDGLDNADSVPASCTVTTDLPDGLRLMLSLRWVTFPVR
jgi:hypothetical protein